MFRSFIMFIGFLSMCSGPATETVFPGKNWEESSPESQGLNNVKLNRAMDYLAEQCGEHKTRQAVLIRNGYLVWQGDDIDHQHNVWSCSKSFTSTVLGMLIDDGKCRLETEAAGHLPDLASGYPAVSLRHFTTMTSGYDAVGGAQTGTPFKPESALYAPGSMYKYHDCAMNQFGLVLTRIAGEPMEELFRRRIADPIGMDPSKWDWHDWGSIDGLVVNGGAGNKSKGIHISARELARFGHLFLNRGNWNGQQLIPADWVDMATRNQVDPFLPVFDSLDGKGPGTYGFNWWVNGKGQDGKQKWPSAPPGTYAAMGHNNNVCMVIPEWNMVIVRLGIDGNIGDAAWDAFLEKLSDAVESDSGI